jgi:hypothetical protein
MRDRRGSDPARRLATSLLLASLLAAATAPAQRGLPLRFESEVVRLLVAPDSVTVDGLYVMSCAPDAEGSTALFYPYPRDARLGGARSLELTVRVRPDTAWRAAPFREIADGRGARWQLPLSPGDTLEVHTVYKQALRANFARYIVTTTSGWEHPLRHARFEITLPENAEPVSFSFPFERCDRDGRRVWCYEATGFRPDRDIDVSWRLP